MTSRHDPSLILWDIDRTLVDIRGVSREIYAVAFASVTGQPLRELADMVGRTERAILLDTLALNGISAPETKYNAFYEALGQAADTLRERMRTAGRRIPGAEEAIASLVGDGVVQSVVTGNIKSIAIIKLETFGLAEHIDFEVGGYGSDDSDRATLVRLARGRAEAKYGLDFQENRVIVIGDTPHDIKGAHDTGALAIGVATGGSSIEELAEAKADVVLADLTDTAILSEAVFKKLLNEDQVH